MEIVAIHEEDQDQDQDQDRQSGPLRHRHRRHPGKHLPGVLSPDIERSMTSPGSIRMSLPFGRVTRLRLCRGKTMVSWSDR